MKAARYSEYGQPDVLELVDIDEPHAGPGEVRISVRAAGVNQIDWKIRAGLMREMTPLSLPTGSGLDAAGLVDEIGDGVEGVAIGDAVFGMGTNTYAEYAVLSAWALKPDGLPFAEAAGYPGAVEAAQRILDVVGVEADQTVLISGAAGGVGSAAVQFARARGANVIGTASPAKTISHRAQAPHIGLTPRRVFAALQDGRETALSVDIPHRTTPVPNSRFEVFSLHAKRAVAHRLVATLAVLTLLGAGLAPRAAAAPPACPRGEQAKAVNYDAATKRDPAFSREFRHCFASVRGVQMHYVHGGSSASGEPPLVLLHGWPQSWYEFREVMPALARERRVIAVDLPGLGDSTGRPASMDKRTLAQHVRALIRHKVGRQQFDLAAHDFGAGVGYQVAAQFGGEVRRFVFMDYPLPGPAFPADGAPAASILNASWHFGFNAEDGLLPEQLVKGRERTFLKHIYDEFGATRNPLRKAAVNEFVRTYRQPRKLHAGFDLYRTLPRDVEDNRASAATPLRIPVLLLGGGPQNTGFYESTLRPTVSDLTVSAIAGARHWLSEENPRAVERAINSFLDRP